MIEDAVTLAEAKLTFSHGSSIDPANLGLDPSWHAPIGIGRQNRYGPTRHRLVARGKSANPDIVAVGTMARDTAIHLLMNPDITLVHERPHVLTWYDVAADGRTLKHEFIPAFAVLHRDGSATVVHVLDDREFHSPRWTRDGRMIADAYQRDHGVRFTCLNRSTVTVEPLLSNLNLIRRHLPPPEDREALTTVRGAMIAMDLPATIGAIRAATATALRPDTVTTPTDRTFSAILELAWLGEVRLDLSKPISDATTVRWFDAALDGHGRAAPCTM